MTGLLLMTALLTANFGRVHEVWGDAYLVNDGLQELVPNFLIEPGDLVETDDGRVEVELNYGTVVWIGRDSRVWFHEISEDRRVLEVVKGRVYVRNRNDASDAVVQVPQGFLRIEGRGALRVRVRKNGFVYVKATDGRVTVDTDEASTVLHEDEALELDPYGYITYRRYAFDEDFDRWCRRRERVYVTVTVEYVPAGIWIGLVDLNLYGRWIWVAPYGWVWVPRTVVAASWRPYLYGHWVFYADIGWVWVSYEPWGWVPYHYGRWAYVPGHGWVWVPGGVFRGGWVAWHTHDGVVAWAPLGPDDRPVRVGRKTAWIAVSRQSFLHPRVPRPDELRRKPVVPYREVRLAQVPERRWQQDLVLKPPKDSPVWVKASSLRRETRFRQTKTSRKPRSFLPESHRRTRQGAGLTAGEKTSRLGNKRSKDQRQLAQPATPGSRNLKSDRPPINSRSRTPRLAPSRKDDRNWIRRSFEAVLQRSKPRAGISTGKRLSKPSRPSGGGLKKPEEEKTPIKPQKSRRLRTPGFTPSGRS